MGRPLKVLIAEDSEDDALLVLRQVKAAGFEPDHQVVASEAAFRTAFAESDWDLVLSDYTMPSFTGADALRIVRESGRDVPLIIISGTIGEELAVSMMKSGAQDYLVKGSLGRLGPAIERELREANGRREREGELEKSEALFRTIYHQSPIGMGFISPAGVILDCNDTFLAILGSRRDKVLGFNLRTGLQDERLRAALVTGLSGSLGTFEGPYTSVLSGRTIFIRTMFNPVLSGDRTVQGVLFSCEDITSRKKTEEELRKSEERFQLAMRGANDGLWDWDLATDEVYYSPRWKSMLGYGPDELPDTLDTWKRLVHPDDRERTLDAVRALQEGRSDKFEVEFRMQHKEGSLRYILSRAFLAPAGKGAHARLVGTHVDITERKKAETDLSHMHELMQYVISHAQSAIAVHDRAMRYIYVSEQYLRQYQVEEKDVIGKHHYEVFPDLPQKWRDVHQRVLKGAVEGKDEDPYVREDGSVDWTRWECRPWYEADGSIGGLIVYTEVITERKRQEQALAESEANYRTLFESATDGIFIIDLQGRLIDANRTAYERLGYTRDEFLSLHIAQVDHPDYAAGAPERMRMVQEQGIAIFESGHRRKDGSLMPVEVSSRILDYKGQKVFFSVVRDITERKRAQEENDRLARAVAIVTEGIAVTDERDRFVYVNDAHARTYGFTPQDLLGKTWRDVTPARLVPLIDAELTRTLRSREIGVWSGEASGMHRDGTELATEITATSRWGAKGEYLGHICVVRDITERKRTEEKVRQSEQFVRNILDTVDEGFLVIDRDYRIITANKAYCGQSGRGCDDIIGRHCYEVSHRIDRPCYESGEECAVRQVFATGEPHTVSHKHQDDGDQVLYVETKAFPIKDEEGNVTSVIETINNITEKHLLEEERLKTQKLESIGTLAGGIAHDFNNLLQGVFGYISMARLTHGQRDKSLAMLEQAEKALHQAVSLTSQLLTFSKGGKPLKKVIDLRPVVEDAAKFALSGSRSDLRLDIAPDLRRTDADDGQVGQVVQNIVLNADQAMPLGGTIEITARNLDGTDPALPQGLARRDHVLITVKDAGIGIPEQLLGRIFDPYFTTKEKGNGLGLATAYSIIRNHDGHIAVRSTVGRGTEFSLYLPAAPEAHERPPAAVEPAGKARKGRVLVMDDEELVRMIAGELLMALGHEAAFAPNGDEALRMYGEARAAGRPYDAVILDLTVRGGMGGRETVRKLRELDPGVKAVVSSGYSDDEVVSSYREHGFQSFLKKPYDIDALRASLGELIT